MATNLVCRDGVAPRLIFIPVYTYISRLGFYTFGISYKCMIHGMVRILYNIGLRTTYAYLFAYVASVSDLKWNM